MPENACDGEQNILLAARPARKENFMVEMLNCAGLSCPEPVLRVRRYIEERHAPAGFSVVLDNRAACQNVARFLASQGYTVHEAHANSLWTVRAERASVPVSGAPDASGFTAASRGAAHGGILIFIASSSLGNGDDSLGKNLIKAFLSTLPEMGESLWRLVFVNSGVLLALRGSPVLEQLRALEARGVGLHVCGACLEHFGMLAEKAVGETTNMLDIVTGMQLADKVIRI
jgi:selenium metabolism protein YedF